MDRGRELYWQSRWREAQLERAERVDGREKHYSVWTYPGTSGFLHLGHLRGLVIADSINRYHRMRGRQVFFPSGTHASGLPAVTFAQRVKDRTPATVAQLEAHGVPQSKWEELEDPAAAARFLGREYLNVFRELGILIDERAYVTTIDDDYQSFIRWQFHRLDEAGALIQAPHFASVCPVCGPVSVDPSETDLSQGGRAEWIDFATVPFPLPDGRILLAATLRPETIYGVTNLWIAPESTLVVWHHGEREFVVSQTAAHRLTEQHGGRVGHSVAAGELLSLEAKVPLVERNVPIFLSHTVDPEIGTGIVMSVPAHAPADWIGLQELPAKERARLIPPRVLLQPIPSADQSSWERTVQVSEGLPAERAAKSVGLTSSSQRAEIEQATERLYRLEFARGRMLPDFFGGKSVAEARLDAVKAVWNDGSPINLQEFSEKVLCRNGHEVVIRRVPDQWFLRYGDAAWKSETKDRLSHVAISPPEYAAELPGIIDWFQDRPCVRKGRWLGTAFPLDPSWVIEPIADSTLYPAYYVVRPYVASGEVPMSSLSDAFFDFVFLGKGPGDPSVPRAILDRIRRDFLYWYPLDANIGGKEHKRVHFPTFLFTHSRLLPASLFPRGILVHWWLTEKGGGKISKKKLGTKGGAMPPMKEAFDLWGADALRLFYALAASADSDIEWEPHLPDQARDRLDELDRLARSLLVGGDGGPPELEAWLESAVRQQLERIERGMKDFDLREVAEAAHVAIPALFRRYLLRGGSPGSRTDRVVRVWIRLLAPITPHLAEELGNGRFDRLVAMEKYPSAEELEHSSSALAREALLDRVEEDVRNVLRPSVARNEFPEGITFFVAEPWKREVESWLTEKRLRGDRRPPIREIAERAKLHPDLSAHLDEVAGYVQRVFPAMLSEPPSQTEHVDELSTLVAAQGYLIRRFGFRFVNVVPEGQGEVHDPMNRRSRARPGRPAFFLVGKTATRPVAG